MFAYKKTQKANSCMLGFTIILLHTYSLLLFFLLGSGPKGLIFFRTQGWISRCRSIHLSVHLPPPQNQPYQAQNTALSGPKSNLINPILPLKGLKSAFSLWSLLSQFSPQNNPHRVLFCLYPWSYLSLWTHQIRMGDRWFTAEKTVEWLPIFTDSVIWIFVFSPVFPSNPKLLFSLHFLPSFRGKCAYDGTIFDFHRKKNPT